MKTRRTEILIVGGGTGGCAAALVATRLQKHVIMTEVTDWIGGQFTAQAIPPDEHTWIESFGSTRRYREFRTSTRDFYKAHYPISPAARSDPYFNPGKGYVSRLGFEPRVGLAVLEQMMAYPRAAGFLEIRLKRKPLKTDIDGDYVRSVTFLNLETGQEETIEADYILDATELGDLLPLAGVEYATGCESQRETGEPHAVEGAEQADNMQAINWVFAMSYDPEGDHTIDVPVQYKRWQSYVPDLTPPWGGELISWDESYTLEGRYFRQTRVLFPHETDDPRQSLWNFRRIVCKDHYSPNAMPREVTLVGWMQNDYFSSSIIDKPEEEVHRSLEEARQLSLSLFYWMQTEAPRPDGGRGYPGLYLCPDVLGTDDGLAKYPYIREARRIKAVFTVTENHIGAEARGQSEAEAFFDSVGIGLYHMDLHCTTGGNNESHRAVLPFQIPLGMLIPVRVENLLPSCKNVGTTHITNGAFRLHPVEWNIGEAAGLIAAFCHERKTLPRTVREKERVLADLQSLCRLQGIELEWPKIRPEKEEDFVDLTALV